MSARPASTTTTNTSTNKSTDTNSEFDLEQLKNKLVCAFCLNSLENRGMHEVKTGKKATSEQILSKDGEAISFLCDDCKGGSREPKFAFNKSGQQVDLETLPSLTTEGNKS